MNKQGRLQGRLQARYKQATCMLQVCRGIVAQAIWLHSPMVKATGTTRFLETLQGGLHPSWSQLSVIKNALVFWSLFSSFFIWYVVFFSLLASVILPFLHENTHWWLLPTFQIIVNPSFLPFSNKNNIIFVVCVNEVIYGLSINLSYINYMTNSKSY